METQIGEICNYYGHLNVREFEGKYFWGIENYTDTFWEEIPKSLYDELLKFESTRIK